MKIQIIILFMLLSFVSGCIDKQEITSDISKVNSYAKNISVPDPCLKIKENTTCVSDINISVKIDKTNN